jgi:PAS domain S-box-containing protein
MNLDYLKHLNILYVEDNKDSLELTTLMLNDFFNKVIIATNGVEALEKFKQEKIDVVITDINMPKMNGIDLIKEIRKIDKDIFIIMLSAHNEDKFFLESIKIGVDGYLLKPIDLDAFLSLMDKLITKEKIKKENEKHKKLLQSFEEAINKSALVSKTDKKGIITYTNDAFCKISGYSKEELIGKPHNIVRHPDTPKEIFEEMWNTIQNKKIFKGIIKNKRKDGSSYYVDSLIMPILDENGEIQEYLSLRHDITHIMNPVNQLKQAIINFNGKILIYLKLNNYENLEEFYDSKTLDKIENVIADYIKSIFEKECHFDQLYILGNGEYAIITNKYDHSIDKIKKIQEEIKEKIIKIDEFIYNIDILVSLVYEGDRILESAKLGIKRLLKEKKDFIIANNLYKEFQETAKRNIQTIHLIKKAIEEDNIKAFFQPIINNQTKEIEKYESLIRLKDKDKILSPFFFLEIAKKSNYYQTLTTIMINKVFKKAQEIDKEFSINLSIIDIESKNIRKTIYILLEENKEIANRIIFEMVEDENVKDFENVKTFVNKIKEKGAKIAIDDFGSGYSNYKRLIDYQPDILKIDGSLIKDIQTDKYSQIIVQNIVDFAKKLNIKTVAEFIENEKIYDITKNLGVDYSQGYYFGRPQEL